MPSAKEFEVLNYLVKNISHKSFDNDDKVLIIDGTKDFQSSFPEFLNLDKEEKKELIFSNHVLLILVVLLKYISDISSTEIYLILYMYAFENIIIYNII